MMHHMAESHRCLFPTEIATKSRERRGRGRGAGGANWRQGAGTRRDGEEGPLGKDTESGGWDAEGSSVKILLDAGIFFYYPISFIESLGDAFNEKTSTL